MLVQNNFHKTSNKRKLTWAWVSLGILLWFSGAQFTNTSVNLERLVSILGFQYREDENLVVVVKPSFKFWDSLKPKHPKGV